jgi:hypothetical protein
MDYERDTYIDETALDIEWLEQPELARKYGEHWAECVRNLTLAEEKVKLVRAELIKQAHEDADEIFGQGVKPTGQMVEAYYRTHKRHKKAKDEWVQAQYEANNAEIAKFEISRTRKSALENLVVLHGQSYFAGPKVPRNLQKKREDREAKQREINKDIGKRMQRMTRNK